MASGSPWGVEMESNLPPDVGAVFDAYAPELRTRLFELRRLILATAHATEGVGDIEETLKWGEPSYLTAQSKSGSTIRIGPLRGAPGQYGLFFNCQTSLVESFRQWSPRDLRFEGNRGIVFNIDDPLPREAVADCIAAALTYHRDKRRRRKKG